MNPVLSEIAAGSATVRLDTLLSLAEMAPAAAVALLAAVCLAVYGLVRFDLDSHLPLPR